MKLLTVKQIKNSWQFFNENGNLIGERSGGFLSGINERLKINDNVYKLKHSGFLWDKYEFFDH